MFASPSVLASPKLRSIQQDAKPKMKQVHSVATMASSADSDASVEAVEVNGTMVMVHEDLKGLCNDEEMLARMMALRLAPSGTFPDCGDIDAEDVKPDGHEVQSISLDARVGVVVVDGTPVDVHEDLQERYNDEATLAQMMRLRLAPVPAFDDCGDVHSLDGWGTKGASPTIRMQIECGAITLDDTLQRPGQPGAHLV